MCLDFGVSGNAMKHNYYIIILAIILLTFRRCSVSPIPNIWRFTILNSKPDRNTETYNEHSSHSELYKVIYFGVSGKATRD